MACVSAAGCAQLSLCKLRRSSNGDTGKRVHLRHAKTGPGRRLLGPGLLRGIRLEDL